MAASDTQRQQLLQKLIQKRIGANRPASPLPVRDPAAPIPLSFGQRQIWLHSQVGDGLPLYNEPFTVYRRGPVDAACLERSLNELIRRHEILRTVFPVVGDDPVQVILPELKITLACGDVADATDDALRPFDLAQGPLIRARLVSLTDTDHRLFLALHHLIFDGVSIYHVLLPELAAIYEAFSTGVQPGLPPAAQYADYAIWQRQRVTEPRVREQLAYWRDRLSGECPTLDLPGDRPRLAIPSFRGGMEKFHVSGDLTSRLKQLARTENATLYMLLAAAFYTLLYRYTGQEDILIGTITAGRSRPEFDRSMGYFLNPLVLRADLSGAPTFPELLARVRQSILEALANSEIPYTELVTELGAKRDRGRNPFFDILFSLEPPGAAPPPGWDLMQSDVEMGFSKFDIYLELDERTDGLDGRFFFNADLFDRPTITRMRAHWNTLLTSIVENPGAHIDALRILPDDERRQVLVDWNATQRDYPQSTIHGLVEAQVERTPQAVAVSFEGVELTYDELNRRANRSAQGLSPGTVVPVQMDRSIETIVSLLAILKAGAAYLPLDPSHPAERIQRLIEDAKPHESVQPSDLAYIMYTSGSTGAPKGVMVPHAGVCNRLLWMQETYPLSASDRVLQKTPLSFDVSVAEIFGTLIAGARLVIARPGGHKDPQYLVNVIQAEGITQVHFVPSMLQVFLDEPGARNCTTLGRVLCSGETLAPELAREFHSRLDATLLNLYGPTEASIEVTCSEDATLGRPIANARIYILDRERQPVPIGIPGELYIGGIPVARGYLNQPELTAASFVSDPFSPDPKARMYKTGDRARFLPDGRIEFLGRTDRQVKIRGMRVELAEIEHAVLSHPGVRACTVSSSLVAHVVSDHVTSADLQTHLRRVLPVSMLPRGYTFHDQLPVTPHGKLDRAALNETQRELAAIWEQLLGVQEIGADDDFFALGGDSLLLSRLLQRIEQRYGRRLSMPAVYRAPTLQAIACLLQ